MKRLAVILVTITLLPALAAAQAKKLKPQTGQIQVKFKPDRIEIETKAWALHGKVEVLVVGEFRFPTGKKKPGSKDPVADPKTFKGNKAPAKIRLHDGTLHLYQRITVNGRLVHESGDKALYLKLQKQVRKLIKAGKLKQMKSWRQIAGNLQGKHRHLSISVGHGKGSDGRKKPSELTDIIIVLGAPTSSDGGSASGNGIGDSTNGVKSTGRVNIRRRPPESGSRSESERD